MTKIQIYSLSTLVSVGAVSAAFIAFSGAASAGGLFPYRDSNRTANGAKLYGEYCASCHGTQLEGEANWRERDADGYLPAPPHDASGHTWHHDDATLLRIVTIGTEAIVGNGYTSKMTGFGDTLSQNDLLDIMGYIKSTWPKDVIDQHNQINTRAGL